MHYDRKILMFVGEIEGILFVCEEEPTADYEKKLHEVAKNYYSNLDSIIEFMMPGLQEEYGDIDVETVKEKLGKPMIDYDNGVVDYCEQEFDYRSNFNFEFYDDEFKDLRYFSIYG